MDAYNDGISSRPFSESEPSCSVLIHNEKPGFVIFLGFVVVLSQAASTILTPLWLDSVQDAYLVEPNGSHLIPATSEDNPQLLTISIPSAQSDHSLFNLINSSMIQNLTIAVLPSHHITSFFVLVFVNSLHVIFFGCILLVFITCYPGMYISERELYYPKSEFIKVGACSAISGILMVYASSGRRTAPFLQAILMNLTIPITFTTRYLLLKKKPTLRKVVCGLIVILAEFLSLLTTIFPNLQPSDDIKEDGGAQHGAGRYLWPLCFVISFIPSAVSKCFVESNLKGEQKVFTLQVHVNPIYFLFWQYLTMTILCWTMFWVDVIPSFGSSSNLTEFGQMLLFNIACVFSGSDCSGFVSLIAFLCVISLILQNLAIPLFLKNAEGTNYVSVISALQTPLVLLFWTLFIENPFVWCPHLHVSTWLSLVAIAIMIPAIYIYNTGEPERIVRSVIRASRKGRCKDGISPVLGYGSMEGT